MTNKEEKIRLTEAGVITEWALLAYLHDQLSSEDRHEMERLLKDDPFAQEALEGLKSAQDKDVVADSLVSIRRKVHKQMNKKEKRVLRIHWTNYAWAAVILGLLISLGTIMIVYLGKRNENGEFNKEQSQTITEQKKEEPVLIPAPVTASDSSNLKETNTAPPTSPVIEKTEGKPDAHVMTGNTRQDTLAKPAPSSKQGVELSKQKADKNAVADIGNEQNARVSNFSATQKSVAVPAATANYTITNNNAASNNTIAGTFALKDTTASQSPSQQALKTFYTGDYKKAEQQFDDVLKQQPQDPDALFFGGISDYVNGNLDKSEKNFDQLLQQHKKFMDSSKWYKANILLKQGKKEEAKKLFQQLSETSGSYKERAQKKLAETQF